MYLRCLEGVVSAGSCSHTWSLPILPPPVKVVSTCGLSPAYVAIILKCAIGAAWKFIGLISTVVLEVTYLGLVYTSEVLTDVLLYATRCPSWPRVETKWSRCWLT